MKEREQEQEQEQKSLDVVSHTSRIWNRRLMLEPPDLLQVVVEG